MINTDVIKGMVEFSIPENRQIGEFGEELFRAGQIVEAGCYVEVDGIRQVVLEQAGILPASLDGRRALYRRYERAWIVVR